MNIHIQIFVRTCVFISLECISRSGISGSFLTLCLISEELSACFSKYVPSSKVWGFQFLHSLNNACLLSFSDYSHPSGCDVVSHGFQFAFPWQLESLLFRTLNLSSFNPGSSSLFILSVWKRWKLPRAMTTLAPQVPWEIWSLFWHCLRFLSNKTLSIAILWNSLNSLKFSHLYL